MRRLRIKDIGQIVSGSTPSRSTKEYWNGNIPWVTPKELTRLDTPYLNDSQEKITEEGYKSCSARILPKGSILFSSRAPIGLVAVTNIEVCTNQGFKSIIPNEDIDSLYLYYALKHYKRELNLLGTGTTF
ncbi:restriction endonuclease subunit S, partial [Spirosoma sp. HMF4905]